jgi:ATP-dependent Clp protease ATP-binding subunit ClpC
MGERFTERSHKVVVLAQDEARRFNHDYIGTEHLPLGLLREDEGIPAGSTPTWMCIRTKSAGKSC